MKKIFVTTFATAFVMALALPAVAQSVCGAVGTAGLPSCTSARSGVPCCVPPRGQIYNKGKGKKLVSQHLHVNEIQESTAPIYEGPQDFNPGSGNGNGNGGTVDPSSYKAKKNVATATVPAEKGIGGTGATPTVAPSAVKSASAPAAAVTATAAAPAAASAAKAAPAAAAAASSAKAASAGASRGGGAAAKGARR